MVNRSNKYLRLWLVTGCIMIFMMIIIGGITRLTGSGLSIVQWDLIMGILPPLNQSDWESLFDKYKQFPQYKMINYDISLEGFKIIFWWEYIHRAWGRLLGIVFIIPFLLLLIKKKIPPFLLNPLLIILLLGALQGVIGWWMVRSGLADKPSVSPYRLGLHLILASILLAYTFRILLISGQSDNINYPLTINIRKHYITGLVLTTMIFLQIFYGGLMAGLKAGLFYPTFPKIKGQWIPDGMFAILPYWKNLFENITTVQFIHRYLGIAVIMLVMIWFYFLKKEKISDLMHVHIKQILLLVIFQITTGIFNLYYRTPLMLAIIHQIVALFILLKTVRLCFLMRFER